MSHQKYAPAAPYTISEREWPNNRITGSPQWCAVDLRDGNQALPNPMTPSQKHRYFELLTEIGFKQIEIGFPSASNDDFTFCREVIENDRIPQDVTISVLTQAREHLIARTFEALKGVKKAVIHLYIATSDLHMEYVFGKDKKETKETALNAVKQIRETAQQQMPEADIGLQFSPEEFTDSNLDFVVDLCEAVVDTWKPEENEKVVLNLPATVERRPPNEYADMIEEFIRRYDRTDQSIISVHAHNDMGTAVAASELTLMAGAERVEGTLLGHGERSGNVDLLTLALNLQYMGVDTGLDFTNVMDVADELVELTGMPIHPRAPYVGELVFTAFAGSHQDAVNKGIQRRDELTEKFGGWKLPYIHIAPQDLGRSFDKFVRINSQSGKGGIAHVLHTDYGLRIPRSLLADLSRHVQQYADQAAREVESKEVWDVLNDVYVRLEDPIKLLNYWPRPNKDDPAQIEGEVHVEYKGETYQLQGTGTGPIAAFVKALRHLPLPEFSLAEYEEDAIGRSAEAEAICYVAMEDQDKNSEFGIGVGPNIDQAAVRAIVSSLNRLFEDRLRG